MKKYTYTIIKITLGIVLGALLACKYDNCVYDIIPSSVLASNASDLIYNIPETNAALTYKMNEENNIVITGYSNIEISELLIPESISGQSVIGIDDSAFANCHSLKRIIIPEGVIYVNKSAFSMCTKLEQLIMPDSLKTIGHSFIYGTAIKTITIPKNVIDCSKDHIFRGARKLEEVIFAEGMKKIPDYVLRNSLNSNSLKHNIMKVGLPEGLLEIGVHAFEYCVGLSEINIPNTVKTIGGRAFAGCNGLCDVFLPDSITSIGNGAFSSCKELKTINIPSTLKSIPNNMLSYCTSIESFVVPEGITEIGDVAFGYCAGLKELVLPNSLVTIGQWVIRDVSMDSLTIPKNVVNYSQGKSFLDAQIKRVVFEDGTSKIPKYALSGSNVKSVYIPSSVTAIDEHAFENCEWLEQIIIPDSVMSIGNCAFQNCKSLKTIKIPNSVSAIGNWAFRDCAGLERIELSSSIEVLESAFGNCVSLKQIEIPKGIKEICGNAFSGCSGLVDIKLPEGLKKIGHHFIEGTSIKTLTIPTSVTDCDFHYYYSWGILSGALKLEKVIFEKGMNIIPDNVLVDSVVKSVVIPSTVTAIGDYAFSRCESLKDIYYESYMESWRSIFVRRGDYYGNECIDNATIHYNYYFPEPFTESDDFAINDREKHVGFLKEISYDYADIDGVIYSLAPKGLIEDQYWICFYPEPEATGYCIYYTSKSSTGADVICGIRMLEEENINVEKWNSASKTFGDKSKEYIISDQCNIHDVEIKEGTRLKIWHDDKIIYYIKEIKTDAVKFIGMDGDKLIFGSSLTGAFTPNVPLECETNIINVFTGKEGETFVVTALGGIVNYAQVLGEVGNKINLNITTTPESVSYYESRKTFNADDCRIMISVNNVVSLNNDFEGSYEALKELFNKTINKVTLYGNDLIKLDGKSEKILEEFTEVSLDGKESFSTYITADINSKYNVKKLPEDIIIKAVAEVPGETITKESIVSLIKVEKQPDTIIKLVDKIEGTDISGWNLDGILTPKQLADVKSAISVWLALIGDSSITDEQKGKMFDTYYYSNDGSLKSSISLMVNVKGQGKMEFTFNVTFRDFNFSEYFNKLGVSVGPLAKKWVELSYDIKEGYKLGTKYNRMSIYDISGNVYELEKGIDQCKRDLKNYVANAMVSDVVKNVNSWADAAMQDPSHKDVSRFCTSLAKNLISNLLIKDINENSMTNIFNGLLVDADRTGIVRRAKCPVDVYVYYQDELVGCIKNDQVVDVENRMAIGSVVGTEGSAKYVYDPGYGLDVVYVATGEGEMKYTVEDSFSDSLKEKEYVRTIQYDSIPLSVGKTYYDENKLSNEDFIMESDALLLYPDSNVLNEEDGFNVTIDNHTGMITPAIISGISDGNTYKGLQNINVTCEKACVVAYSIDDGKSYRKLTSSLKRENSRTFELPVNQDVKLFVGLMGDTLLDGEVTLVDATQAKRFCVDLRTLTPEQQIAADITGEGELTLVDATQIKRYCVDLRTLSW